jgi:hypothetical protein
MVCQEQFVVPKAGYEASTVAVSQNARAFGRTRSVSGLCAPDGPENTKTWYVFPPESIDATGKLNGLDEAGVCSKSPIGVVVGDADASDASARPGVSVSSSGVSGESGGVDWAVNGSLD